MTQSQAVKYWLESAKRNVKVAEDNLKLKHYDWCLFLWQLVIEKTLKGLIAKRGLTPLPIHNLNHLVRIAGLKLDEKRKKELKDITSFNLEARYDDYKLSFYKKATPKYTKRWVEICRETYQWLQKFL